MAAFSETQTSLDNFDVSMKETGPQLVPSNTPNDILAKSKIRDSMPRLFGSPVNDKPTNVSELAITDIQQNSVKSQVNTSNGDEFLTPEYEDACMEAVQVSKEIVPETFFGHVVHTRDNMKFITHIPDICLVRVNTNGSWTKNFSSVERYNYLYFYKRLVF